MEYEKIIIKPDKKNDGCYDIFSISGDSLGYVDVVPYVRYLPNNEVCEISLEEMEEIIKFIRKKL
jgi:hypothetical protein